MKTHNIHAIENSNDIRNLKTHIQSANLAAKKCIFEKNTRVQTYLSLSDKKNTI